MHLDGVEGCIRDVEGQKKPVFLLNNPDIICNLSQVAHNYLMVGWYVDYGILFVR